MSPELIAKLTEIAKKHGKELASELVSEVAFPALEQAVKNSASPIDDVVLAALKEPLKAALVEMIGKI